jgi:NAD(P)-dependent dehydrogenase (short-subunit alcohol dehydrogenase family)
MILQNKNAVIYGAGGSLGSTVAAAFAQAGAKVFVTGRNIGPVQQIAAEIIASGGAAEAQVVDALDEKAVNEHLNSIVHKAGSVDISFNAIGTEVVQNIPLITISAADFMGPVNIILQSQFLTATAAAKVMIKQASGVILFLTATPGGIGYPLTGGFAPLCSAVECFSRNLAAELGIYGVRAVNIRSGGSPDSKVFKEAIENHPEVMETVLRSMENDTMLKKMPLMADIANVAVFLASGLAGKITGVTVDVTSGTTAGLNYRMGSLPAK